jgi:hypothetical protein
VGHLAVDLAWGFYRTGEHEKALPIIEDWLAAHPEPTGHEAIPLSCGHLGAHPGGLGANR